MQALSHPSTASQRLERPSCFWPESGRFLSILSVTAAIVCGGELGRTDEPTIRFDRDIRPILSDNCYHCHGPDRANRQADLRLDVEEDAKSWAIVPGNPDDSELVRRIRSDDPDTVMPPPESNKRLTESQMHLLVGWVRAGAPWTQHWSFVPPDRPVVPKIQSEWIRNPIDAFTFSAMEARGLQPAPEADRVTLIRRLAFDLTGLPPKPEEVDAFLADRSSGAYERLVDRLLASEHFGERMAAMWLDAARYGDTSVYHADGPRDMWAWRDAVVAAYNDNMRFDQFTIAQLAGDLLPDASLREQILSGFNRNNGTTDEGGAIPEEYRVEYAVDRVKTTSMVWLGLSMECGQCHDHKYDPISQEEYYQFFAFFNVSADGGMQTRKGNAPPMIDVPDPLRLQRLPNAVRRLESLQAALVALKSDRETEFQSWLNANPSDAVSDGSTTDDVPTPMLYATFDEGEGDVTTPIVGDIRGQLVGNPEWIETPYGRGLRFSGQAYVDLGDVADFERDAQFSYGGWVKPAKGVGALLARMDDRNGYRGFDLYVGPNGASVHLIHHWPDNAIKVTTKTKLDPNRWHHVFATYDGTSKASGIRIYINGVEQEWAIEQDNLRDTIRTGQSLWIGSRNPGSRLHGDVDSVQIFDRHLTAEEVAAVARRSGIGQLLAIPADRRSAEQTERLRDHFLGERSPEFVQLSAQIAQQQKLIDNLQKPLTTVMVMQDMAAPRPTYVLRRGAYDAPTEQRVEPDTPKVLPPMSKDLPRNRLGLARWLFQENHPLTARVAVNRYWQMLFGSGLVATPEDFGSQGAFPTHPELLDWLAVDFRDSGWDIKRTIKQMVMTATYRQSSHVGGDRYSADPHNRWLARGPRFRLQAEFIRDMALSASGLLVPEIGGPGLKPYQPPGLWAEVGLGGQPKFVQDHGEKLYRRSIYTYWKRSAPPPAMLTFDAPTREKCTLRRARTNTPLQALVLLNDPQFVEAGRALAARTISHASGDPDRLAYAFRLVLARLPTSSETDALLDILEAARREFGREPGRATAYLAIGESPVDPNLDPVELAAWSVVGNTLLNLDEAVTRE